MRVFPFLSFTRSLNSVSHVSVALNFGDYYSLKRPKQKI